MAGSQIGLLYENLSLQTIKNSFRNNIAVYPIFRMHSTFDQKQYSNKYLCTVCCELAFCTNQQNLANSSAEFGQQFLN